MVSTCVKICDIGSLIHGKAAAFAGISSKLWHTSDPHPRKSEAKTQLRYSWLKCRFLCQSFPGLWLKIIHNWDLRSCPEWASWMCMKRTLTSCKSIWMLSFQPRNAWRATNKPLKRVYLQYVVHFVYFCLVHSHHVFFDTELGDTVHTNRSWYFTFRCRRLIPLHACEAINLCLISMLKAAADMPSTVSSLSTVRRREVPLRN